MIFTWGDQMSLLECKSRYSKHKGFIWWSMLNLCWEGQRYCFSLAFLPHSFSGDTILEEVEGLEVPLCPDGAFRILVFQLDSKASKPGYDGWWEQIWWLLFHFRKIQQNSSVSYKQSVNIRRNWNGLCRAQKSYLHCTIFWEITILQHSFLFPDQNTKI